MFDFGDVSFSFLKYLIIFIAIVGVIGSILTYAVFFRKRFLKSSFAFYFKIMAITDVFILVHIFRFWAQITIGFNLDTSFNIFCQLGSYSFLVAITLSNLTLTLIAFDRLLRIVFPQILRELRIRLYQFIIFLVVFIISCGIYIIVPISSKIEKFEMKINETANSTKIKMVEFYFCYSRYVMFAFLMNLVISIILVLFINNILSAITFAFIHKAKRNDLSLMATRENKKKASTKDRTFAINSVAVNFVSFITQSPFLIYCWLLNVGIIQWSNSINIVLVMISIIGNSSLFFVNLFTNSIFYKEFGIMVKLLKNRQTLSR